MRIADADTHISNVSTGRRIPAAGLLELMDESAVEQSLIWLHPGQTEDEYCDYIGQNKYIHEAAAKYSSRFIPVGWINPAGYSFAQNKDEIDRIVEVYGFKAIKLNGAQNYFDILDEKLSLPIVEEIVKRGVILAFHCGDDENTNPTKVGKIAGMYPECKILMVHMGQTANDEAIEEAVKHPNVYLIGSGMQDTSYVRKAVDTIGSSRVCFGSDAPFSDLKESLENYTQVLAGLSPSAIEDVMGLTLLRLFNRI